MKKSYFIAFGILIIAGLWIGSGFLPADSATAQDNTVVTEQEKAEEQKVMKVQVKTLIAEDYTKKIAVNGRSEASKNVMIRAEAEGQIVEVIGHEGDNVEKGNKVVKIDVLERRERVREARELVKQRKIEFDAAKRLVKDGFASDVRVAQTQSAYESARASLKRAEIALDKTTVIAPFDGVLGRRMVDVGDYVSIADPISEIFDLNPLEITVFVNEKEVVQLQRGNAASLVFSGGEKREGIVDFIAPAADQESRTFQVTIKMDNEENQLPAGLTAQVGIQVKSKKAFKIKPSILTLDDAGILGVKSVTADNKIEFVPVEVIEDTSNHVWVTGVNDGQRVVTVGQDFVVPGQNVEPVEQE